MVEIEIRESACRGCQMCVEICPTDVFVFEQETAQAKVAIIEDCIGCLSCAFVCPTNAITHSNYHIVKNFYRDLDFCRRMEKYL